jgi:hypothetical protein
LKPGIFARQPEQEIVPAVFAFGQRLEKKILSLDTPISHA